MIELKISTYLNSRRKRCAEIVEISLFAPLALLAVGMAGVAIKLEDGGDVFYKQVRMGKDGKPFTLYKLRTMKPSDQEYAFPKRPDDERLTAVGKVIRPPAVDEFPQILVNMLLKGDMSLFGPRALPVGQYQELLCMAEDHPDIFSQELVSVWQKAYESTAPGGLSLAIARGRSSLNLNLEGIRKKMEYDTEYVQKASFLYDLWILKETITSFLSGNGAW